MAMDFTEIMKDKSAYLDKKEVDKMLNYCSAKINEAELAGDTQQEKIWMRNYMLIMIMLRSGRRITEIVGETPFTTKVGLRPCDIRDGCLIEWDILKKDHIKRKNKAGQERSPESIAREQFKKTPKRKLKPIDEECFGLLRGYVDVLYETNQHFRTDSRIFPITRFTADKIVKKIAKACNIRRPNMKIHCHMFRHTFAIWLLKNNPNDASVLRQVQEMLDHSDIKMTMTYAQFTQDDKREKLDSLFIGA